MPEYSLLAVSSVALVLAAERWWLRTGILRTSQYWISMTIVFGFMVLVNGWLTKLSDPVVLYDPEAIVGLRVPWDIPVEDFAFGFSMITLTLLLWSRAASR